jgi:hypothetical protein
MGLGDERQAPNLMNGRSWTMSIQDPEALPIDLRCGVQSGALPWLSRPIVLSSQDQLAGLTPDRLLEVERVLTSNHGFLDRALLASPGGRLPLRHRCLHELCCRRSVTLRVESAVRSFRGVVSSRWPAPTLSPLGPL